MLVRGRQEFVPTGAIPKLDSAMVVSTDKSGVSEDNERPDRAHGAFQHITDDTEDI
jgi:hypothetical protein